VPRLGPPPLPCHEKRDPVTNMTRGYTSHRWWMGLGTFIQVMNEM
jgi:hypothetical protein